MPTAPPELHGWALGDRAIFLKEEEEHVHLYIQETRSTELLGVFIDQDAAYRFQVWLDEALGASARANAELIRRLEAVLPPPEMMRAPGAD